MVMINSVYPLLYPHDRQPILFHHFLKLHIPLFYYLFPKIPNLSFHLYIFLLNTNSLLESIMFKYPNRIVKYLLKVCPYLLTISSVPPFL